MAFDGFILRMVVDRFHSTISYTFAHTFCLKLLPKMWENQKRSSKIASSLKREWCWVRLWNWKRVKWKIIEKVALSTRYLNEILHHFELHTLSLWLQIMYTSLNRREHTHTLTHMHIFAFAWVVVRRAHLVNDVKCYWYSIFIKTMATISNGKRTFSQSSFGLKLAIKKGT